MIGTRFLQNFQVILDEDNTRIGLGNIPNIEENRNDWLWTFLITSSILIFIVVLEALLCKRILGKPKNK